MRKNQNHEEQLISSMMTHLEINHPDQDFTSKVMDRVSYEPMPARVNYEPLIGRTAWFVIGVLLAILVVVLVISYTQDQSLSSSYISESIVKLPDFNSYTTTIMDWVSGLSVSLTWYSLCLALLFLLTAINQVLKRPWLHHNFVL